MLSGKLLTRLRLSSMPIIAEYKNGDGARPYINDAEPSASGGTFRVVVVKCQNNYGQSDIAAGTEVADVI